MSETGDRFDELYNILISILNKQWNKNLRRGSDPLSVKVPYYGEIALVSIRWTGFLNVEPFVKIVYNSNDEPDYGYTEGSEPHLKVWLMRPDVNQAIKELEKTIFMLS